MIILIGFKASGKTTLAKAYAEQFNKTYADTDELLLKKHGGKTITELYQRLGEDAFRKAESKILDEISECDILATGGGIIQSENNIEQLKKLGKLIYLKTDKATLYRRMMQQDPLPGFIDAHNAESSFETYYNHRAARYQRYADRNIDTEGTSVVELCALIAELI